MDPIAESVFYLKYPDGQTVLVCMRVGRPVELSDGKWHCGTEVIGALRDGHDEREGPRRSTVWVALPGTP